MRSLREQLLLVSFIPEWEVRSTGLQAGTSGTWGNRLHGGVLPGQLPYPEWLALVERNAVFEAVSPRRGASTFFAVRLSNHRLIETVNIRHTLNEYLRQYSGHIGYGVRPCERGKGYAGQILRLSLKFACSVGLHRLMLVCDKNNPASARTILSNGGILERESAHPNGEPIQIYWMKRQTARSNPERAAFLSQSAGIPERHHSEGKQEKSTTDQHRLSGE